NDIFQDIGTSFGPSLIADDGTVWKRGRNYKQIMQANKELERGSAVSDYGERPTVETSGVKTVEGNVRDEKPAGDFVQKFSSAPESTNAPRGSTTSCQDSETSNRRRWLGEVWLANAQMLLLTSRILKEMRGNDRVSRNINKPRPGNDAHVPLGTTVHGPTARVPEVTERGV
ncbi:hypothetical protein FQN60_018366, partial [Etheostoma spectabile]